VNGPDLPRPSISTPAPNYTGSASSAIDYGGDLDYFQITAPSGTTSLNLSVVPASGLDSFVELYNSSGTRLQTIANGGTGGTDSASNIPISAGATYYVGVSSFSKTQTGSFTLNVDFNPDQGDYGDPPASVPPDGGGWIWANQNGDFSGSASISSGAEVDVYAFMPNVTGSYVISTAGSLDSQLRIYNIAGAAITGIIDSTGGGETNTQIFTSGSWYYIAVAGYQLNTGNYTLSVNGPDLPRPSIATPAPNYTGSATGYSVDYGGDLDYFQITAPSGTTSLNLTLTPAAGLNSYGEIYDSAGNYLTTFGNGGTGSPDTLSSYAVSAGATYYVGVSGVSRTGTGSFTLNVVFHSNQAVTLLPDLIVWASQVNGYMHDYRIDTQEIPGRVLLRFSTAVANVGTGPMELRGATVNPNGTQDVLQRIFNSAGGFTNRLAGIFTYHPTHGHIHFDRFAEYKLREVTAGNGVGNTIGSGVKRSFCLLDLAAYNLSLPGAPGAGQYAGCGQIQGISVGWADVYANSLPDQWIDVTAVPSGTYWLEVTADPDNQLSEADENNNTTSILVTFVNPIDYGDPPASVAPGSGGWIWANQNGDFSGSASISSGAEVDVYAFMPNVTGSYVISTAGSLDSQLRIYNIAGAAITGIIDSTGGGETNTQIFTSGSWYYIAVAGYQLNTGNYTLSVNGPDLPRPSIATPAPNYTGSATGYSVDYGGDLDYFQITAPSGTTSLNLTLTPAAGLNSYGEIYNSAGNYLTNFGNGGTGSPDTLGSYAVSAGATYYVGVSGVSRTGTGSFTLNVDFNPDPDTTPPTVTINQAAGQSDPTSSLPINFTVVFSESVTGFGSSDVTLGGTAGATGKTVTGSGTTYNVAVSGMTQSGTVTATIPAGAAQDAAGNNSLASTGSDNSVTYNAPPQTGSLQVNLAPAGAVSAGAQWQVDGGAWQNSGATVSGLSVSSHTVAFNTVSGWAAPANRSVTVNANQTTTTTGTYAVASSPTISRPRITGTTFTLAASTQPGVNYVLEFKTSLNLINWTPAQTNSGNGSQMNFTNNGASGPSRFYRIRIQ